MDFVIRLIKDKKVTGLAADHFGYEDLMFKATNIILLLLKGESVAVEDFKFVKEHLYKVNLRLTKAPDMIIDDDKKVICNCLGFEIKQLDSLQDTSTLENIAFERVDLLLNEEMSYQDFDILYEFLKNNLKKRKFLINNQYIFTSSISEKY